MIACKFSCSFCLIANIGSSLIFAAMSFGLSGAGPLDNAPICVED